MTIRLTTLFITTALALPGVAAAKPGGRDFGHTFPVASRLCQRVADGHVPKRFADRAADVTAACDTLHSAYDAAVAAAPQGNRRTYHQSIKTARRAFWTTVKGLRAGHPATDPTTTTNPTDEPATTDDQSSTPVVFPGAPDTA
jgi:hypothetical protein